MNITFNPAAGAVQSMVQKNPGRMLAHHVQNITNGPGFCSSVGDAFVRAFTVVRNAVVTAAQFVFRYMQMAWSSVQNAYANNPREFLVAGVAFGIGAAITGLICACRREEAPGQQPQPAVVNNQQQQPQPPVVNVQLPAQQPPVINVQQPPQQQPNVHVQHPPQQPQVFNVQVPPLPPALVNIQQPAQQQPAVHIQQPQQQQPQQQQRLPQQLFVRLADGNFAPAPQA